MDTLECIRTRRSVRKYQNKEVSWDDIVTILEAGRMAPSSGNIQNWKFVVIREPVNIKKISEACYNQDWMINAPVLIVITADPEQGERFYGARGEHLYTIQNCAAATENMLLAANALGLGGCWVGAFDEPKVRTLCQLPEQVMTHAILTIGYASEKPLLPPKKRIEWLVGLEKFIARKKTPQRGYTSQVWPKIIEGAKRKVKKHLDRVKEE